ELPDCSTPRRRRRTVGWSDSRTVKSVQMRLPVRLSACPLVRPSRAGNGTRTRDPNLGKVVLYQLSYSRAPPKSNRSVGGYLPPCQRLTGPTVRPSDRPTVPPSGGEGDRTPALVHALHALSHLTYPPCISPPPQG